MRCTPYLFVLGIVAFFSSSLLAASGSARETLRQGNRLYGENQYAEAVSKYNDVLVEQPQAVEPKFNKANSYYRLDDLSAALDLYQQVAAESKDMALVGRAKYNLGNCYFQRGTKQRDSNLQKAVEDMETSIANWRQVLDLDPQNKKAAKNIEVARLTIKDILDQIKKQKEQQNQQNQQNKQDQQKQQQQQQKQDQSQSQKDPNQPQDPNQAKKSEQKKSDPNEAKPEQKNAQEQPQDKQQEAKAAPDATAREILDTEQRQKKEREMLQQKAQYRDVEKDW